MVGLVDGECRVRRSGNRERTGSGAPGGAVAWSDGADGGVARPGSAEQWGRRGRRVQIAGRNENIHTTNIQSKINLLWDIELPQHFKYEDSGSFG